MNRQNVPENFPTLGEIAGIKTDLERSVAVFTFTARVYVRLSAELCEGKVYVVEKWVLKVQQGTSRTRTDGRY